MSPREKRETVKKNHTAVMLGINGKLLVTIASAVTAVTQSVTVSAQHAFFLANQEVKRWSTFEKLAAYGWDFLRPSDRAFRLNCSEKLKELFA